MPSNRTQPVLVCYDIRSPKRLAKIYRFLSARAFHIQYSVFLAYLTPKDTDRLLIQLKYFIDERQDDLRLYALPNKAEILSLGQSWLPQGMLLVNGVEPLILQDVA